MKQNRLNILMIGPHLNSTGGIPNVVNNLIEAGLRNMVHLKYISTLKKYVPGRYIYKLLELLLACLLLILEKKKDIDIVHLHFSTGMSFYRKLILFKIAKFKKKRVVIHLHGSEFEAFFNLSGRLRQRLIKYFFDNSDGIITLSMYWKNMTSHISTNKNIVILHNGADLTKYSNKLSNVGTVKIVFMGRLGIRKGVYDLLRAFELVMMKAPYAHLYLGGDGDIDKVKKIIAERPYKNNVHVLGWVSGNDKIDIFRSCDIYVLPSYNEGLPGSILEAMAVGVPIVTTMVGGIPEAVIDNRNGFLLKPGDIQSLADRLIQLCKDDRMRVQMGKESRAIMFEKFDIKQLVLQLCEFYQKIY